MIFARKLFAVLAVLCFTQGYANAADDYSLLMPQQPTRNAKKIEVREFFFYGCIHCFHLHPLLSAWEKKKPKDVEMVYVPTIFRDSWQPMANTYYALELMGKEKKLDDALYSTWHDNNVLLEEDKIADFVAKHGVDRKKFLDFYNSFSVASKVTRSKQMLLEYHIQGTPTLVVDGKYVISGLEPEQTIAVLNKVVKMAREEHAGKR